MKLSLFDLKTGKPVGQLDWQPTTGELSGTLAARVLEVVEMVKRDGSIEIHPIPNSWPIDDPLRSRRQMAAILAHLWRVPELAEFYPTRPDETPDFPGTVN